MKGIRFEFLDKTLKDAWLPRLFDILYHNMKGIVPWADPYDRERDAWLAAVRPAMEKEPRQIILMFAGEQLVGYFQYYVNQGTFMIEEVQILPEYRRTTALPALIRYLMDVLPEDVETVSAYAHKMNLYSQKLIKKLGMEPQKENGGGDYILYLGDFPSVMARFGKKK